MDAERISISKNCLDAAHDGTLSFPDVAGALIAAGFEGYHVDYRCRRQTFFLPDGDCVDMPIDSGAVAVSAHFDAAAIEKLVRWAQSGDPEYS